MLPKDYKGHTPLDLAKNDEIRELLIKRGVKKEMNYKTCVCTYLYTSYFIKIIYIDY